METRAVAFYHSGSSLIELEGYQEAACSAAPPAFISAL